MRAVEEIINVEDLKKSFRSVVAAGELRSVMDEIISQSSVEFDVGNFESVQ